MQIAFVSKWGYFNQYPNENTVFSKTVPVRTGCNILLLYSQDRMLVEVAKRFVFSLFEITLEKAFV